MTVAEAAVRVVVLGVMSVGLGVCVAWMIAMFVNGTGRRLGKGFWKGDK